ncbi:MAG: GTP 3',8-cyclase MoaA [Firmicutes bacterium]|jgi:cyclic pyranopterin phosphate synthase|nr:GTP 3',8-cyclase MoaA [Bacillota bacterium]
MRDQYKRKIDYMRISVTDRCNLRCVYCMPQEGVIPKTHQEILTFEEIYRVVKAAVEVGIRKIRLTGGEPLVRKGIPTLVELLANIPEIEDLALTTNGILLADMAEDLYRRGLRRVNVSLDTLDPGRYRELTRGGDIRKVWEGIEAALKIGFDPVKINVVVMADANLDELPAFADLTRRLPLHVRFIEVMPLDSNAKGRQFVSVREMQAAIHDELIPCPGPQGAGPARYFRLEGALGTVGFISPISGHFCGTCNRLRLTADGVIRPCLCSTFGISLRDKLRSGLDHESLVHLLAQAIASKPKQHNLLDGACNVPMSKIGG